MEQERYIKASNWILRKIQWNNIVSTKNMPMPVRRYREIEIMMKIKYLLLRPLLWWETKIKTKRRRIKNIYESVVISWKKLLQFKVELEICKNIKLQFCIIFLFLYIKRGSIIFKTKSFHLHTNSTSKF